MRFAFPPYRLQAGHRYGRGDAVAVGDAEAVASPARTRSSPVTCARTSSPGTAIVFSAPERAVNVTVSPPLALRSSASGIAAANSSTYEQLGWQVISFLLIGMKRSGRPCKSRAAFQSRGGPA